MDYRRWFGHHLKIVDDVKWLGKMMRQREREFSSCCWNATRWNPWKFLIIIVHSIRNRIGEWNFWEIPTWHTNFNFGPLLIWLCERQPYFPSLFYTVQLREQHALSLSQSLTLGLFVFIVFKAFELCRVFARASKKLEWFN